MTRRLFYVFAAVLLPVVSGCGLDMKDQPRQEAYESSSFFKDGRASRDRVEGTVARGFLHEDEHLYTGKVGGKPAETFPFEIDRAVLERGRERYGIFCSVCHGATGEGNGMIVRRGFKQPPSFHEDRLRNAVPGYFFDVMTHGYGVMADYAQQVSVKDRWAIAAYLRVLQKSQHAAVTDVPSAERAALEKA